MSKYIPINKGNYSLDTKAREELFEKNRGFGVESEYKQNRIKWAENPKSFNVADYPLLVDIELASLCNLKCPMCYTITDEFKQKVRAKLMDWSLYTKIIDEIEGKVFAIRLSLRGESTLHKQFIEAISYAKSHGIKEVSTLSNGSKLKDKQFCRDLVKAGLDWITVSADGVGETYNKIRRPITFDQILQNLRNLKEVKAELNSVKPVVKVQGIWPAMEKNPSEYYNAYKELTDLIAFNPLIDYMRELPDNILLHEENFSCPQLYQRLVIGADGRVLLCSNDEEVDECIGDVNLNTVHEIWHGKKMTAYRDAHKQTDGFKQFDICKRCYLPRKTNEETHSVNDREFTVKNYVNSSDFHTSIDDIQVEK